MGADLANSLNGVEGLSALGDWIVVSESDRRFFVNESRRMMRLDIATALAESRDEGQAERIAQGHAEGLVLCICSFERVLRRAATPQEQLQRLSLAEMESLVARLEAELSEKRAP